MCISMCNSTYCIYSAEYSPIKFNWARLDIYFNINLNSTHILAIVFISTDYLIVLCSWAMFTFKAEAEAKCEFTWEAGYAGDVVMSGSEPLSGKWGLFTYAQGKKWFR